MTLADGAALRPAGSGTGERAGSASAESDPGVCGPVPPGAGGATRPLRAPASRDHVRGWPLRRVFAVGAWVGALLSVLAVVLGGLALNRLTDARSTLVDVIGPARDTAQDLSVALLNQQTGVRGFELSARPEFLEPYRTGLSAQQHASGALRELSGDPRLPSLAGDLDAVDAAVQRWHAGYVDRAIVALSPGAADPMLGQELFDDVRAAMVHLVTDLDGERAVARARIDGAAALVRIVGGGIAAALVAFLVAVGVGLRRGVLTPVSELAGQARQVVSGDVRRPVRVVGPPELVELGADVEAMRVFILQELDTARDTNERLDQQARDLERSNRDLEQFAYVASHDLQEPLRKVASFCQLLKRRYGDRLDERGEQYIEFAVDGAQRMQQLINDLLAFSRVGRTTDSFEPVALGDVAAAALGQLERARAEAGGEIVVGDLPVVRGDPALLRQLLVNLLGNALKFRRAGVAPVVRVDARRAAQTWEITVTDNGIGIEPEYADKVFVIFQRLHGRDRYPGTGIGLALAKKIVEFHGGRIRIDHPPDGPGTVVRFTLPAEERQ